MVFGVMIDRNGYLPVHTRSTRLRKTPGRVAVEHRQQPQPPNLHRSRRLAVGPQFALLYDPELRPRHGQRPSPS